MSTPTAWLTWTQAAELVGCPVSTIESQIRTGRIESRPRQQGRREGSLKRESVEEFAVWWRKESRRRKRLRAQKDQRRIRPPEPEGWIQASEAAKLLGHAYSDHVVYLARQGRFEARKVGVRWWVREDEIRAYARERDQWVSHAKAAELAGCSAEAIRRAVNAGLIETRGVHRTQASLRRTSVEAFAATRQMASRDSNVE